MKIKLLISMFVVTSFLYGCGDKEQPSSREKSQVDVVKETQPQKVPAQEQAVEAPQAAQEEEERVEEVATQPLPKGSADASPEEIEAEIQALTDEVVSGMDLDIPREELEGEIRGMVEAMEAERSSAER